jgi:hypothetical protein
MRHTFRAMALIGTSAAVVAAGLSAAEASAAPVVNFQVEQVLFTGDPWPVSYEAFSASTARPGVARVTVTKLCNSFNRSLCLDYTRGATVSWWNTSTGATGASVIPDGAAPGSSVELTTGPGTVAVRTTSASAANTIIPGIGWMRVT